MRNFLAGNFERIRFLWRCAINLFANRNGAKTSFDATDGESNNKLWRRCLRFIGSLFTRHSRISPSIEEEKEVFPRLKLPQTKLHFMYDMDNKNRGIALVFNHEHFYENARRLGTEKDRDRLKVSLERFGFEVRVFNDLTFDKMEEELDKGLCHFNLSFDKLRRISFQFLTWITAKTIAFLSRS